MELKCAFVLTLISYVSAIPHGHNVKGGASAKAEASAVAGAFGGIAETPFPIPTGASFSGSFSKASSSSFAASSGSSSSSSFSYSGAGAAGLNGVHGLLESGANNVAGSGSKRCSSGGCQNGVNNGLSGSQNSDNSGSGIETHNGANSAISSGSGSLSGSSAYTKNNGVTSCSGENCSSQKASECEGSNCDVISNDGKDTNLQTAVQSNVYDSNDIHVNTAGSHGSKSNYNSNAGSANYDKTSSGYGVSGTHCTHGNCEPSSPSNLKPSYPSHSTNIHPYPSMSTQETFNPHLSATFGTYNKGVPATYLTTPKESLEHGTICTSSNCNSPNVNSYSGTEKLPSSYNVPIHSSYPNSASEAKNPTCISGNCGDKQPSVPFTSNVNSYNIENSNNPSYLHASSHNVPSSHGGSSCATGNCDSLPANQISTGIAGPYPGSTIPIYSHGASPAHTTTFQVSSAPCKTPGCAGISSSPPKIGSSFPTNPSYPNTGFPTYITPSAGGTTTNCVTPNCSSQSSANANSNSGTSSLNPSASFAESFGALKPNTGSSPGSQKAPTYTGGFGGPSGLLKPNDFSLPSKQEYSQQQPVIKPSSLFVPLSPVSAPASVPISHHHGTPVAPTGTYSPVSCTSGSCGPLPVPSSPHYSQNSFANVANTAAGAAVSANAVVYAGGFGGPPGLLKPYDSGKHGSVGHSSIGNKPSVDSQISSSSPVSGTNLQYDSSLSGASVRDQTSSGTLSVPNNGIASKEIDKGGQQGGYNTQFSSYDKKNHGASGCTDGCESSRNNNPYNSGAQFGINNNSGLTKSGILNGGSSGSNVANDGATNKNFAEAVGGSRTQSGVEAQISAAAQASAISGATAGALSGGNIHKTGENGKSAVGECNSGCSSNGSLQNGSNIGLSEGFGLSNTGILDGINNALNVAGATSKSVAGAVSGANVGTFGLGHSFANSAASAHASSGVATKGGYGR